MSSQPLVQQRELRPELAWLLALELQQPQASLPVQPASPQRLLPTRSLRPYGPCRRQS